MRGRGFLSWRLRFRSAFRNAGMIEDPAKQAIERLRQTSRAFRQMLSRSARWPLAAIELPLQRPVAALSACSFLICRETCEAVILSSCEGTNAVMLDTPHPLLR